MPIWSSRGYSLTSGPMFTLVNFSQVWLFSSESINANRGPHSLELEIPEARWQFTLLFWEKNYCSCCRSAWPGRQDKSRQALLKFIQVAASQTWRRASNCRKGQLPTCVSYTQVGNFPSLLLSVIEWYSDLLISIFHICSPFWNCPQNYCMYKLCFIVFFVMHLHPFITGCPPLIMDWQLIDNFPGIAVFFFLVLHCFTF